MTDQENQYPYPAPPFGQPPAAPPGMPPRPMPMKMPAGVKMPPRPMGYPMPPGVKMPPRPMGVAPISGQPMPVPAAIQEPVPAEEPVVEKNDDADVIEQAWADENGIIDDLPEEIPPEEEIEEETNPYDKNMASDLGLPPAFIRTPMLLFMFFLFMATGAGLGFFYGTLDSSASEEMPGVVSNSEIPKGRPRCGIAQQGQGCVLYVMNAQRRDVEARDFFSIASDMLQIPKFQIETANIRYATTRIPPGYIALLNIPPVQ